MKKWALFFLCWCCTLQHVATGQPASGAKAYIQSLSYLPEAGELLSPAAVQEAYRNRQFKPLLHTQPNFGRSANRHWLSVVIFSEEEGPAVLELSNPFLYGLSLYRADTDLQLLYQTGSARPFAQRPLVHRRFAFPLDLRKGRNHFLLLADRRHELLRFSLRLYNAAVFQEYRTRDALLFGWLFGIMAFIAFFALLLWRYLQQPLYGQYFFYILLMLLFVAADNGWGYQWAWPQLPVVQKYVRNLVSVGAFIVQLRFMQTYLQQTLQNSGWTIWVNRLRLAALVLFLLLVCYAALDQYGLTLSGWPTYVVQVLFYGVFLSGIALLVLSSIDAQRRGIAAASFYLLAMLPLLVQMVLVIVSRWHWLNIDLDTALMFGLAVLLEIITLGCGLVQQYVFLKKEKEALALQLSLQDRQQLHQVLEAQETERRRIAEDLHDQLGGTLSAVKAMIGHPVTAETAGQAQAILEEACKDLRFIAHGLMPAAFGQCSLEEAISESVKKANLHGHTRFSFVCSGEPLKLSQTTELMIFRMGSEMIQNVIKHAAAGDCTVQLVYHSDHLQLMVEDDGVGFITAEAGSGIGMKNLYSRARYIKADLCYDSGPEGTTVICTIPLARS